MAVKDEFILAVMTNGKVDQYIEEGTTTVIDAEGRLAIPGLHAQILF